MGLLSILPANLSFIETWITRLFLLLALLTFGPWAVLLIYDLLLYIVRSVTYNIPFVGGRARGKMRPRAPSLTERPSGHRRRFSLARRPEATSQSTAYSRQEKPDAQWRQVHEESVED
ncbi:hypothetical protein K491DRAFT_588926 [Lophiostoma macrostomum CBS 122681]|uniref:Uncharacterized protein n=1 Tax=Lophiostoma macrostomum CBS 122681 TaxID=1314788 RepID=A0A6A6TPH5_9PLEO|nr:hypothetical protein K491DRAFT_588926 [Lophiostoma macrostomum CBS 122681]